MCNGRGDARVQFTPALDGNDVATRQRAEALIGRGRLSADLGDAASALRDLDDAVRLRPGLAERADVMAVRSRALAQSETRT